MYVGNEEGRTFPKPKAKEPDKMKTFEQQVNALVGSDWATNSSQWDKLKSTACERESNSTAITGYCTARNTRRKTDTPNVVTPTAAT